MKDLLRHRRQFRSLPPERAVDVAYQVMLRRDPDPTGRATALHQLQSAIWSNQELIDWLRGSSEYTRFIRFPGSMLGPSLHSSRCQFVRSLPPARTIVDLGGTDLGNPDGALVTMGYPYPFERLTIIDLPSEDRHEIYRQSGRSEQVDSALGPVFYRYHSMTDLSGIDDASVDLVYSGQSIEHISVDDGRHVLSEVLRILKPGGHLGLDTPNARVTRLQQEEFVDPDHKVEYRLDELTALIEEAGLQVVDCKGANYSGRGLQTGTFDADDVAGNSGLYWDADSCYLLCLVARRP